MRALTRLARHEYLGSEAMLYRIDTVDEAGTRSEGYEIFTSLHLERYSFTTFGEAQQAFTQTVRTLIKGFDQTATDSDPERSGDDGSLVGKSKLPDELLRIDPQCP